MLRYWRVARRFSQLDLAMQADISSKHVSFLETGKNRPSREMILRLTQAMDVPLRDRNLLLHSAGFAPVYGHSDLDAPTVQQAEDALSRILDKQDPYPAIVLDAEWNLLRQNRGALALAEVFLPGSSAIGVNALDLLFSADGLQPFVLNWEEVSALLLTRVYRETLAPGATEATVALFERLISLPTTPGNWREIGARNPGGPTLDMVLQKDGVRYAFFTTVTTFGTAQDITLQELRIESYFPADAATRSICEQWL